MIAGVFPPSNGTVTLDGEDVTGLKPHELFARGLVRTFQIAHEYSSMPVIENLMVPPPNQRGETLLWSWLQWGAVRRQEAEIRDKAEDVLAFLRLTDLKYELAGNLSGGQKKLLELGRTMMTDAKVVLLDEVGAGVNRTLLGELSTDIERLNRERGFTFFVIEHDMDLIARLCDPVIVMAQGTVLTQGSMADIRANEAVIEAYLGGGVPAETGPNAGPNAAPGGASETHPS
ncbi:MAG: ATP-binding cassette domain-containing protein [Bauldia litoralis]